ncbi:histone-like nucleoid-structuring protein Lsr2 [Microlunatus antarcticus]|nr:Lsr2 family protein [Microlunatus antarcticus]
MAQRVQVILEDDLDGSEADETVMFGLDGVEYEVDLSTDNAQGLRDALAQWVAVARRTGGRRKRTVNTAVAQPVDSDNAPTTSDIRAWAQDNGYEVSSRGRVSTDVREAYEKANG